MAAVAGRKSEGASIVTAAYPQAQLEKVDAAADAWVARLKALVGACRNLRSEMALSPGERVPLLTRGEAPFIEQAAVVFADDAEIFRRLLQIPFSAKPDISPLAEIFARDALTLEDLMAQVERQKAGAILLPPVLDSRQSGS